MSTVRIIETCACGATFTVSGDPFSVANRQCAFHKQHAGCRKPEPGMCGDPSETVIDGEKRTTMFCQLRAGHAGFHEDGQGCSWGRPRWTTRAGGE